MSRRQVPKTGAKIHYLYEKTSFCDEFFSSFIKKVWKNAEKYTAECLPDRGRKCDADRVF